jgi:hypothetical protein
VTVVANTPGQGAIAYRVADFATVRRALLQPLPGEQQLAEWRPGGAGDLAAQLLEWWAYLADVLTFYNERLANEAYLRTAVLPENVRRLIRTLGYRPRPGIAAHGTLAVLLNRSLPLTLPAGFAVQNKPGPGHEPQTFEVDAETTITPPDVIDVDPPPRAELVTTSAGAETIVLRGTVSTVRRGDRLLLLPRAWTGSGAWVHAEVSAVAIERDPRGRPRTRVTFASALGLTSAQASQYRVLKSLETARPWPHDTTNDVSVKTGTIDLESIVRQIRPGDPVVLEAPTASTPPPPALTRVTATSEPVWYANAAAGSPNTPPTTPANVIPIPIPHTRLTLAPSLPDAWKSTAATAIVRHTWLEVGEPIASPAASWTPGSGTATVAAPGGSLPPLGPGRHIQVEDSLGSGVGALASPAGTAAMTLEDLRPAGVTLSPPLRALFGLVTVSRGETAAREVLGSGDATRAFQEFTLRKVPLTYLPAAAGYTSTLRVWVDDIEWHEVESFLDQPADARVFVTREDDEAKTHVRFGDGINGQRLPSGTDNVVARYRFGSGAEAPATGTLTDVQQPLPNLRSVRNPVPVGGGADPDPPQRIRRYAPRSVLTFGRAVSGDDYEVVAAQTPGVARARVYWSFDAAAQRAGVVVYVGDDAAAVAAAESALAVAKDPNRPVTVTLAKSVRMRLGLALRMHPEREPAPVLEAVHRAFVDPDRGLLGRAVVGIDQTLWRSDVFGAVLAVPGTIAVHALQLETDRGAGLQAEAGPRHQPGEGRFFRLDPGDLTVTVEA